MADDHVLPLSVYKLIYVAIRHCCIFLRRWYVAIAFLSIITTGCLQALAQQFKFTALTTKDGLSSNTVNSIVRDKFGLIWIATRDGLNRYDGKEFKVYRLGGALGGGFGSKEINVIKEDCGGTLWVGTMGGGLFRYDRQHDTFRNFEEYKKGRLVNRYAVCLYCDRKGFLWVGTMEGLEKINTKTLEITHVPTGSNRAGTINCSNVTYICCDKQNRLWVATFGGLYRSDTSHTNFVGYHHDPNNTATIPSDSVSTLAIDKRGQLWVGTLNGLARLLPSERNFITYSYNRKNSNSLCGNMINNIAADETSVWVATQCALNIIDINTDKITRYQHDPRNPYSLNSNSTQCIYVDPRGIYWVGSYAGGVNKYDKNLTLFNIVRNSEFDPHGLNWPVVSAFAQKNNGDIYVGCDGGGLNLFHKQTGLFNHIPIKSQKDFNSGDLPILCMEMDRSQNLWIGTFQHGLFCLDTKSGAYKQFVVNGRANDVNQNNIFCIKQDSKGQIWIGTNGAGVNIMNPKSGEVISMNLKPGKKSDIKIPGNGYIRAFEEDQDGCMWIGTYGSGVLKYHPKSGKFDIYDPVTTSYPLEHILSMLIDREGNLWIGTGGDGLFRLNMRSNRITPYTTKNGLPNGVIHKIIEGINGNIWLSTNRGLCKLNPKTGNIVNYSQANGLQSNSFYDGSGLLASDGTLYFGGIEGFNYFKTADIKKNNNIPFVILNRLDINNETALPKSKGAISEAIEVAKEARIPYKNSFAISYMALNYTLPNQNRYKYMLEGFNRSWIDAGGNTTAYYTNLDPGTYTFKVKACNNDGIWNERPASIKIIIPPPFWMTGYAYFIYVMVITGILWLIRRNGIKKLKAQMQVDQERQAAESRHELDLMKIKFLTNLSHEFRTPVSLIMAPADKLLALHPDKHISSQLKVIKRNSRRLLNLVNQLLDFRKMEEHELRLNLKDGELVQFIRDITDSFRDLADAKKIHFSVLSNTEEVYCRFDHDKIERILFNLLSNAFKFTPPAGQVMVNFCDDYLEDTNVHQVTISVKDTGIGLSDESISRIFDRFYQADAPSSILNQGSGIGLAIAKELANFHGGEISVKSEKDQGSTFTLKFNLTGTEAEHEEVPAIEPNPAPVVFKTKADSPLHNASSNPHVLVIEDNDELRNYLVENLGCYYKMSAAIDGRDGWQKALAVHPDLILSDISMPYMDGITLSKKLKSDKRTSHIPIIMLTAHARQEDQLTGLGSGASDYVTKPFNFDILNIKIRNLLDLNKKLKETYQKQIKVLPEESNVQSSGEKFIKDVVLYFEQNIHDPKFSIEDISHHFAMSRGSFYNKVIEFTGQPPVEFIRNLKLEKAAVLLKKTDNIIADIAYQTGFPTPHYFSKSFKTKYGVLPSEYRQQFQRNLDKVEGN